MTTAEIVSAARTDLNQVMQDFIVSSFGAVTSVATAVILALLEQKWGIALYSFTFWFIIPAGAIGCGIVAASGYYFGARLFNHRPTGVLLLNVVAISVSTFFLVHYLSYYFMTVDGRVIRDYMEFSDFLATTLSHQSIQFGYATGPAIEIGPLGYLYALLEIGGFAVGGVAVYRYLKGLAYCDRCSKYFAKKETQARYWADADKLAEAVSQMRQCAIENQPQAAIDAHAASAGAEKYTKEMFLLSQIAIHHCKDCGKHRMSVEVSRRVNNNWKAVPEVGFHTFTDEPISAARSAAVAVAR